MNEKSPHQTEDSKPTQLVVDLPLWIVRDLKLMEKNTNRTVDDLVKTSLMMFIATHNDYLGVYRNSK